MKTLFKTIIYLKLITGFLLSNNINALVGINPTSSITAKNDQFSFSINSTEYFTFNQSEDIVSYKRYVVEFDIYKPREIKKNNKWDNLSLIFSSTSGSGDNNSQSYGISYNFNKRKFGITSSIHTHNLKFNSFEYSPLEASASYHFRFRKKEIKPFIQLLYVDFNDESIDNQTILNLGAFSRINNLSIGTNIVSYFEKLKEGDDSFSYLGVSLSYIFD